MKPSVTAAMRALLRRFQSQRPIRGGSLLVTIFGDALAPRGGAVTLGSLIRIAAPFGLTERLVRTAVARLAQDGWLTARRAGRLSEYRLTTRGQQRFAEATQRIYTQGPDQWEGRWTLLILPPKGSSRRESLRNELRWLGFGQVSPGVFAHPNGNSALARKWLHALGLRSDTLLLESVSRNVGNDEAMVAAGWDLDELARRYRRFADAYAVLETALSSAVEVSPEAAFIIRTLLIHDYRKIHLQDPLLPPGLLPVDWAGSRAYELCARLYGQVFAKAEEFLTETASTLADNLPPADAAVYERFKGIRR